MSSSLFISLYVGGPPPGHSLLGVVGSAHVLGVALGLVSGHLLKKARNAHQMGVASGEAGGLSFCGENGGGPAEVEGLCVKVGYVNVVETNQTGPEGDGSRRGVDRERVVVVTWCRVVCHVVDVLHATEREDVCDPFGVVPRPAVDGNVANMVDDRGSPIAVDRDGVRHLLDAG
jgi:hypothetical protein